MVLLGLLLSIRMLSGFYVDYLWHDSVGLLEDFRARRVNDLLTINVLESISGSGAADTAAAKTSTLEAAVTDFFGAPLNLNKDNLYGKGYTFSPTVSGSMTNDFKGTGTTNRTGTIVGTITARVVEVMPNGTLSVESRKDITINNEKQVLVLRGAVRPEDVSEVNTVSSTKIADAEIFLVGDGVLMDKQKQGWLVRILDGIWPF
jgi:flagellar L-ring protein precursor FlgH